MTGITELGYVRFGASDIAAWRDFSTEIIGAEVVETDSGDGFYLRTDNWHHRISIEPDTSDDLIGAGLRVAGVEEFAEMQHRLQQAGVPFSQGSVELAEQRGVLDIMTLLDPAGNPLEIFHGPRIDAHKPFHPSRGMFGRFVTADGGVGHMILRNNGLNQAYEFYKLLGMRGGVEYKFPIPGGGSSEFLFMHCNSRDHTVAFGPPSEKSINHLMLEVDNIDDVFLTHEKVQASQYPVMISLGKHANDHMFSFYCATPSGWLLEIGTTGRPATHQSEYYTRDMYGHEFNSDVGPGMSLEKN